MIIMLVAVAIVLGGYFAFQSFKAKMIHQFLSTLSNPPQTVSTVVASDQQWQPQLQAVGSLRAVNGATLSLEVAGVVEKIGFDSGQDVQAGQTLLQLRSEDDVAKLQSLQASAALAQVNYDRDLRQFRAQAVSQATLDTDNYNLRNAKAQVDEQQAVVDKKTLRAPFAGHLGIRQVDLGQYLNAGTAVVTLQSLDPLYVDFSLPQQELSHIAIGQTVSATVDTYPGQKFAGKIVAINPLVDTDTRNVQVRASLGNPDRRLLPGMFVTVMIDAGAPHQQVTLPQTAVTYNSYGSTVFLVKHAPKDDKSLVATQTFVTTGATRGDQVAVLTGIKPGDVVVSAGQIKLHNGTPVVVNNKIQPTDNPNPTPVDN
ncbi:MAG TPA: efflux RND transporter periplasmic adaptor subunit [Rhodopila sp.]|uniref:efflux RND transporter periplasmic adaptor subunit n=1 Tax=Rhodopila sp. TaxID=2480087 RepID=UPI002D1BE2ED|nr:efflux RND transporter periplasmic adaptor subunit [Rhodopila sp.]HVY17880.1 efflux RND transporter periplasmic adaptor subunit [Rhodopila sp.]